MISLKNAVVLKENFNTALTDLVKKNISAVVSLKLAKLVKILGTQSADVNAIRTQLLEKYGVKKETFYEFATEENKNLFISEMDSLLSDSFETNLTDKLVIPKTLDISAETILALEEIIDIDKSIGE